MAAHSRSSRPRVALATCAELPRGDADESRLVAALEDAGAGASWRVWDAAGTDWTRYDAVVVRSTWDCQRRREEFLRWAATVPALLNPLDVLVWNTDKRYLAELASEGIEAIETRFVEPGSPPSLPVEGEIVVKPSVSAGSKDTARFALGEGSERDRAERLIAEIHAGGRTVMLQPYLSAVDELGETALVYLDGALSHAVRKGPLLRPGEGPTKGFFAPETIAPRDPSEAERALGEQVLESIERRFGNLFYARVDLVPGDGGAPVVLEVELTEPSLFFGHADDAAQRFAAALKARIRW
jgi:glutathione synthase/RimK-type ligase-like ATP-grasp enzyme